VIGLFRKKNQASSPGRESGPRGPDHTRLYAIGDIHGRADLLIEMHSMIRADAKDFDGRKQVIYLGDYIDRGLQSKQVVEMLIEPQLSGFDTVFLKGNHEQAMLDFLEYPEATAGWLSFGGRETLLSYGINVTFMPLMKDMQNLAAELGEVLPESHREFLEDGLLSFRSGDYYFVHAGIRPGIPLEDQHFEDQLWIRDEFIDSDADHGAVIVHGHTITPEPELTANRIGLDTGAFHSGVLTCLVIDGPEQRLLQTDNS
jgi:serine/threonine protein phosphatase 1